MMSSFLLKYTNRAFLPKFYYITYPFYGQEKIIKESPKILHKILDNFTKKRRKLFQKRIITVLLYDAFDLFLLKRIDKADLFPDKIHLLHHLHNDFMGHLVALLLFAFQRLFACLYFILIAADLLRSLFKGNPFIVLIIHRHGFKIIDEPSRPGR